MRATYRLPYPVARLIQQRFTRALEDEGELALDAPPTTGLTILIQRFEVIGVTELAAAGTLDVRLAPLRAPEHPTFRAELRASRTAPLDADPRALAEALAQALVASCDLGGPVFRAALIKAAG